jgi:aminoglycoside phosphotransferase (APT) family kinase protein
LNAAIDRAAVEAWLRETVAFDGPLVWEQRAAAGSANVTWFVRAGDRRWVVRHPPIGSTSQAQGPSREFRYLRALEGTAVPAPTPIACCDDSAVAGVAFVVVSRVDGAPLHQHVPRALVVGARARAELAYEVIDALSALHRVDWRVRGLATGTVPYLQRQIEVWQRAFAAEPRPVVLAGVDEITEWIVANVPAAGTETIVHGDFGLHNVLVTDAARPRAAAVVDWELAAIGDPLADLSNFLKSWGIGAPSAVANPANDALTSLGAPSADELAARYEETTGHALVGRRWYDVFNLWKSVGILDGLRRRHDAGIGVDADGARFASLVAAQMQRLRQLLDAE